MMKPIFSNINFLAKKQDKYRQKMRRLLAIQLGAFGILAVYVFCLALAFGYYFYLGRVSKRLEERVSLLHSELEGLSPIEAKYVYIKSKLGSLFPIITSQRKNQEIVEAVFSLLPEGISIRGFTVRSEGEINFSVEAYNFQVLEQFLVNLRRRELTPEIKIKYAEIKSVNLRSDGAYVFSVSLYLES